MNEQLRKQFNGMNDADFADAEAALTAARDERRPRITLDSIKPGMKPEDLERTRAEIARLLREG